MLGSLVIFIFNSLLVLFDFIFSMAEGSLSFSLVLILLSLWLKVLSFWFYLLKDWGLDLLWLGFPKLLIAILVSSYTGDHTRCNGHLRDELYHRFSVVSQQNVQLRCNFKQGAPQLLEVHMCFNAVRILTGCNGQFKSCGGRNRFLRIYFPDVSTLPNQCIFFFMRFLSLFVSLKFIFYFGINFLILFFFLLCNCISCKEL